MQESPAERIDNRPTGRALATLRDRRRFVDDTGRDTARDFDSNGRRLLCVSLHDVAPATLPECRDALDFLDALHIGPVSLLVVPDYHGLGRADRDERFCDFVRARARRGDEIVLHGYFHRDPGKQWRGLRDWLERRVHIEHEGEFARLNGTVARIRLLRGLAVLRAAGWQPSGFVAPAWLVSPGTCNALQNLSLRYYATRDYLHLLTDEARIHAPSLVVSTLGPWRRMLSAPRNHLVLGRHLDAPVLRAALHPRDLGYRGIEALWRRLLDPLVDREIVTEGNVAAAH
jgi:predicted deacetylase